MTSPDLRPCCQQALLDHWAVCDARREDPPTGALPDLPDEPQQGGPLL
ncbi:hypothetical protein [Nonomuraea guangzhouensis]|uniref:Uracil-DNA glycosylase n=1 Tax=Nonomuraea guangzhouensis TaxID=1291555 RepID=A0ABW4GVN0_9ACTN|nr:hypothetical protein [Nonomuraea guangzhouensis]